MPLRQMGRNGPLVPALGFGLMNLSHLVYGAVPSDEERFKILDYAVEHGATFWDTSDLYGDGEELLGKWFKRTGKRDQIFLANKFGFVKGSKTLAVNTSGAYCKEACAESLKQLGIESIDLYYVHNANPETPIEEAMRALSELKADGKIKYIGLSAITSATLRRAYKIAPVTAVQPEYSPFTREIEGPAGTNLLDTCRDLGIAVVCAAPLGRGLLTTTFSKGEAVGDSSDARPKRMPRFLESNREHNLNIVTHFKALADKKGCTISQLALAWRLKQGDDIFPIPGTKQLKNLKENLETLDINLTDEEEAEIRAFVESSEMAGGLAPPQYEAYLLRDTKEEAA
ncbi:putative aldo-keto reductase [Mollisia scopiformis]|uniref:Putative aldo-keto reductase n=1 Tax=Mollisia scopiformis TaxID=149040 RepID=A0A194WSE1_MOLSC|nr:putative aldo-keto reductase [Mollisia scopiformis]KUJ10883.1 putative aldo-keto reductase [Mollisia scopiformis]